MNERTEYKGYYYSIEQDENAMNPRTEFDNFGHMICFHKRYNLGDKHQMDMGELAEIINRKDVLALPLFLYDHSGITMSTGRGYPFNDPWDSGQVGYIYITYEEIRKEYSVKHVTKETLEKARHLLESEVETYDAYISGQVYGYVVYENEDGDVADSCWGYYGDEGYKYAEQEAKSTIDWRVKQDAKERVELTEEEVGELCLT